MTLGLDPIDATRGGCSEVFIRLSCFASSLFCGTGLASLSLFATDLFDSASSPLLCLIRSPFLLFSQIFFITFPCLLIGVFLFVRTEKAIAPRWTIYSISIGLLALLGNWKNIETHYITWPIWIIANAMLVVATWFFVQWRRNRWEQEILDLKIENQQRREEISKLHGTNSIPLYTIDDE